MKNENTCMLRTRFRSNVNALDHWWHYAVNFSHCCKRQQQLCTPAHRHALYYAPYHFSHWKKKLGRVRCRVKAASGGWSYGRDLHRVTYEGYTCTCLTSRHDCCTLTSTADLLAWQGPRHTANCSTALPKVSSRDLYVYQCIRPHKNSAGVQRVA